jgi:DNA-binding GntR family transcriptional regulator
MLMVERSTVYRTMTEIATASVKEAILRGEYKPGTRLIPAHLEKELKLGRVAIREGLRALEGEGLVVTIPNKGAVVANPVTPEEIKEVFEIRFDLEGKAISLATANISPQKLSELEAMNRDMSSYSRDPARYFLLNRIFHLELYSASGWKFLCQIIGLLFDQVMVFRSFYPFEQADIDVYIEHHDRLLAAIRSRDSAKAQRILVKHVHAGFENLVNQYVAKSPI